MAVSRACLALLLMEVSSAAADVPRARLAIDTPIEAFTPRAPGEDARYLYLNRCSGGCVVNGATINDARTHTTTIPGVGVFNISEFESSTGLTGAAADADWNAVVTCLREVYSPYAIEVSDVPPPDGTSFNEAVIAGSPSQLGLAADILGVAPLAGDCSAQDNVMSFSFANYHGSAQRLLNICWTAAQESAHAYGLDHEYEFSDGDSACSDPMTYRVDCGGQKFFRNRRAKCGEMSARGCRCTTTQNSHQHLISTFGAATPITQPPTASIAYPTEGTVVATGWVTHLLAGSQRGVLKAELFLNGSRWVVLDGAGFGPAGQADPSNYTFYMPTNVPDGTIDIEAVATDDLGLATRTPPVTVTKGAPCTSAETCADDQICDNGRCMWPAPVGELGDACAYSQFCKSWDCVQVDGEKRCVQDCATDEPTSCPAGFSCIPLADGPAGVCAVENSGCCSVGRDPNGIWIQVGLSVLVLGWIRRRRAR